MHICLRQMCARAPSDKDLHTCLRQMCAGALLIRKNTFAFSKCVRDHLPNITRYWYKIKYWGYGVAADSVKIGVFIRWLWNDFYDHIIIHEKSW